MATLSHPAFVAPGRASAGLTTEQATRRRAQEGSNAIESKKKSPIGRFLSFFWGPIPWMIEIAAVLSAIAERWEDLVIIGLMLFVNAGVGFWEEFKADNAIEALKAKLALEARVLRDGAWHVIDAAELVPDDVVLVRLGNIVPADLELVGEGFLSVDQSALTGESLPVEKKGGDVAYSGSVVKRGEMRGRVTATGMKTYFGRTAKLVETAEARSHFQKAVLRVGNFLILLTLALVVVILVVALFRRSPFLETVLFVLILTVAAIPAALPAVLSVTMAAGASQLAKMRAIVSRLASIEEMAGMDVLLSDKTGTLTKNALTVGEIVVTGARDERELLVTAALTSRSDGDAIDGAVLAAATKAGVDLEPYEVRRFDPFDPVRKRAEAEVAREGATWTAVKGAPQVVLDLASPEPAMRKRAEANVDALAERGYRTLGVARREADGAWRFLGLIPLFDPPRDDAKDTIEAARGMGLSVRMVTGDNVAIARETSDELDLGRVILSAHEVFDGDPAGRSDLVDRADGFAEVFPEHKFKLVKELQARGHIVGMTGDGVNDAPALKQADVGIAVSGATDAARAAADLVLTASGLSVITRAVEEARRIFERMTSYATFRIAETIRVLLFMTTSILVFQFYPVTAVMIVLLAILNDFPIMMIAYDNAPVAPQPVRWDMRRVLTVSSALGLSGVVASFGLFWFARDHLQLPADTVRTLVFLKLLVAGHLTIYVTRTKGAIWSRPWPSWRLIVAAEATQIVGTLAAVYGWFVPPIGWTPALAVWGYALAWLPINNLVKVGVERLLRSEARALQPVENALTSAQARTAAARSRIATPNAHINGRPR